MEKDKEISPIIEKEKEIPVMSEIKSEMPKMGKIELPKKRLGRSEIEQKLELLRNFLKSNKEIINSKAREICGVNMKQANHLLHKLVEEKFVE